MKDILIYKGFIGSVHYSTEDEVFYGLIEGVDDIVTFEGQSVKKLKLSFEEAVNDYIALCVKVNKDPEKSYKGSFNVRLSSELHKKVFRIAVSERKTLNQFVQNTLEKEVNNRSRNFR